MILRMSNPPHGGRRPGSGRKPLSATGPSVVLTARVSPELHAEALAYMKARGINASALLAAALRAYLDAHP